MSATGKSKSPSALVAGLVILAVGIGLIGLNVSNIYRGARSGSWPSVTGTVQSSQLKRIDRVGKPDRYEAKIRYAYEVDGKPYTGTRVKFGECRGTHMEAAPVVARYPRGGGVKVHYDPEDPEDSVLETSMSVNVFALLLGPPILLFGLWLLRSGIRQLRE